MFKISNKVRRLTNEEKERYLKDGYLTGLPVFDVKAKDDLNDLFVSLSSRLSSDVDINQTNMWHKASLKFYNLCRTPAILDYVEDLLGPNFFQWGGQFFSKEPKDGSIVPWHQDAQYWPLNPSNAVTVWLAVFDTDEENDTLAKILSYHVTMGSVMASELEDGMEINSLIQEPITVNIYGQGAVVLNGEASVTTADVETSNGIIHVIDKVLIP